MYLMTQFVKSVSHIYENTDFDKDGGAEGKIELTNSCKLYFGTPMSGKIFL